VTKHAIKIDVLRSSGSDSGSVRTSKAWDTSRDCYASLVSDPLRKCPSRGRAAQQRRRWPPRGSLTILFITSARRAFGRNSVGLLPLCCARNFSLKSRAGDAVAVDPAISSGLPLPTLNRQPAPGSRPEKYSTPATKGFAPHSFFHVTVCV
jgi:hypothetical protein